MYRPNFCSECGAKILRLHWHLWTSRRFCGDCARRLLKQRLTIPMIAASCLLLLGMITGRAGRPAPPPLIIERKANSPLNEPHRDGASENAGTPVNGTVTTSKSSENAHTPSGEEVVYICGARTKKGTPCSRRVNSAVRCWQHKGAKAMLPPERLIVRE
jgi:hypothetical protein